MTGLSQFYRLAPGAFAAAWILPWCGYPAVAAVVGQAHESTEISAAQPTAFPGLEKIVDDAMAPVRRGEVAGAVVAVVKDGRVILLKGYGYADVAKRLQVDPDKTLFRIGSITKTFTWAALTRLIAEGKVGLDQPIDELLPDALKPDARHYAARPILVRHLLTHTAGFEDRVVNHFFLRDPNQVLPLRQELSRYKPMRMRPPGESATYSNYGAALAGAIVENVSGELYADYLERHILAPLQMLSTTAREPLGNRDSESMSAALVDRLAQGYIDVDGKLEARPFEYLSHVGPAGSISSTGADMSRYMLARLSPGIILSAESERRMQSRLFANAPALTGIGYGWMLGQVGHLRTIWHDGGTMAFHSNLVLVPAENLGIFISTNSSSGGELVNDLPRLVLTTYFASARTKPAVISVDSAALTGYSGTYLGDRLSTSTAERFFAGLIGETIKVAVHADALEINGSRVAAVGRDVFATEQGDLIAFKRDAAGRVMELATDLDSFRRLPLWRTPMYLVLLCALTALLSLVNLAAGGRVLRTDGEPRIALCLNLAASLGWLVFVGCLAASTVRMIRSPLDVVFIYPPATLIVALWAAVCAAILSVAATGCSLPSMASLAWPRRIQYAVSTVLWTLLTLALYDWRLLGLGAA